MGADSHANPVVYPIDGGRFACPGRSDSAPLLGLAVATITLAALVRLWLRRGFRLNARAPGGAHL
jgi:ABC-2 type transport system permease protein